MVPKGLSVKTAGGRVTKAVYVRAQQWRLMTEGTDRWGELMKALRCYYDLGVEERVAVDCNQGHRLIRLTSAGCHLVAKGLSSQFIQTTGFRHGKMIVCTLGPQANPQKHLFLHWRFDFHTLTCRLGPTVELM